MIVTPAGEVEAHFHDSDDDLEVEEAEEDVESRSRSRGGARWTLEGRARSKERQFTTAKPFNLGSTAKSGTGDASITVSKYVASASTAS
jgi:hypothetical protein